MDDEILYHYCSNDTFTKILQNKTIRLSSLDTTNDYMEGKWILDRGVQILSEKSGSYSNFKGFLEFVNLSKECIHKFHARHPFLAFCCSKDGDLLSQWRGYAENGQGIAIGFRRKFLSESITKKEKSFLRTLIDVQYSEKVQVGFLEGFEKSIERCFADYSRHEELLERQIIVNDLASNLLYDLYTYKNPAFSEEREVRILMQCKHELNMLAGYTMWDQEIQLMDRQGGLVPYLDLDISNCISDAVTEIVLGPKNKSNTVYLNYWLQLHGYTDVLIRQSEASYR